MKNRKLPFERKPGSFRGELRLSNSSVVEVWDQSRISVSRHQVRKIGKRAISLTKGLLVKFGQRLPIIVAEDGYIISGVEFYLAAKELSLPTLNVIQLRNLSDDERRILSLALDRLPELSEWDDVLLAKELRELTSLNVGFDVLDHLGFTVGEADARISIVEKDDEPDSLDVLPEVPHTPVTRRDDTWLLGTSRLICGDALEIGTYTALMISNIAAAVFTDPPFNVKISGNVSGLGKVKHGDFAMASGELSRSEFTMFLKTVMQNLCVYLIDGGLIYTFMDRRKLTELENAARELELSLVDLCFWDKGTGGMGSFYRSQHEPVYVFKFGRAPHNNYIQLGRFGRYRTNVWKFPGLSSFGRGRLDALSMHPTVKPVALCAEAIKDCTRRGDIVLDPFAGSGSTIIAAIKSGRIGYGNRVGPQVEITGDKFAALVDTTTKKDRTAGLAK